MKGAPIIRIVVGDEIWYIDLSKVSRVKVLETDDKKFPYTLRFCYSAQDVDSISWKKEADRDAILALALDYMKKYANVEIHDVDKEKAEADYKALENSLKDYDPMAALK